MEFVRSRVSFTEFGFTAPKAWFSMLMIVVFFIKRKRGSGIHFELKDEYETGVFKIPESAKEGMIYGGCNCGNCHMTILPTGEIYPCRRVAESKVGNVFEDRIADVWITSMEAYRDYEKFSKSELFALVLVVLAFLQGRIADTFM